MTILPFYRVCKSPIYLVNCNDEIPVRLDNTNIRYYGRFDIKFIIAKGGEIYCYC